MKGFRRPHGRCYSADRLASAGTTEMAPLIQQNLDEIRALARAYGVARLEVFGSACTTEFEPERSDIDFLVEYPPGYDFGPWLGRLQDLEADLGKLLGRRVDLVTTTALRNRWFRREVEKTRTVIYDASEVAKIV
jgi:predicted nucleotidyltransferase